MPWRLIIFIAVFAVILAFISFNLENENRCDISFGFAKLKEVPVFITIFTSFVLGLICAIPLVIHIKKRPEEKTGANKKPEIEEIPAPSPEEPVDPAEARKRFRARHNGTKK